METNGIKAGCGSLSDEQLDQLAPILAELEERGMSTEYVSGVACGLGFVALGEGDTVGFDFKKFVSNAYLNFMLGEAMKDARFGLAELLKKMGVK